MNIFVYIYCYQVFLKVLQKGKHVLIYKTMKSLKLLQSKMSGKTENSKKVLCDYLALWGK